MQATCFSCLFNHLDTKPLVWFSSQSSTQIAGSSTKAKLREVLICTTHAEPWDEEEKEEEEQEEVAQLSVAKVDRSIDLNSNE